MEDRLHPRRQGDIGEAEAIAWLARAGANVWVPLFHSPDVDVVAEFDSNLFGVQVKTCFQQESPGRFRARLATSGGNQSWNRVVKRFDRTRCDFLFVLVGDGRRWLIPSTAVDGAGSISLGGQKYSEYLIPDSGDVPVAAARCLQCCSLRGSAGVGEPGSAVNRVPSAERVRIPPPPSPDRQALIEAPVRSRAIGRTRISSAHQATIPIGPFRAAGLSVGDQFEVTAEAPGRVVLTRVHARALPQ